jgi:hypothetical protein
MCLSSRLLLSEPRKRNTWVLFTVLYFSFSIPHFNKCSIFYCTPAFVLIFLFLIFALEMVERSVQKIHSSFLIHNKLLNKLSGKNEFSVRHY